MLTTILMSSIASAGDYSRIWEWQTSRPPNIVVCKDSKTKIDTVKKGVEFWKKEGFRLGSVSRNENVCQKDWHPNTIIIHGDANLDTAQYNGFSTPWQNAKTKKLLSVVIQFDNAVANEQELVNHELGHALGFEHTGDHNDIMYGGYRSY